MENKHNAELQRTDPSYRFSIITKFKVKNGKSTPSTGKKLNFQKSLFSNGIRSSQPKYNIPRRKAMNGSLKNLKIHVLVKKNINKNSKDYHFE